MSIDGAAFRGRTIGIAVLLVALVLPAEGGGCVGDAVPKGLAAEVVSETPVRTGDAACALGGTLVGTECCSCMPVRTGDTAGDAPCALDGTLVGTDGAWMPEEAIGLDAPVARDIAVGTLDWGDVAAVGELAFATGAPTIGRTIDGAFAGRGGVAPTVLVVGPVDAALDAGGVLPELASLLNDASAEPVGAPLADCGGMIGFVGLLFSDAACIAC